MIDRRVVLKGGALAALPSAAFSAKPEPLFPQLEHRTGGKIGGAGGAGMAGNVLIGGIIGAGVDVATGAMLDLTPNPLTVNLEKDDAPLPPLAVMPDAAPTTLSAK